MAQYIDIILAQFTNRNVNYLLLRTPGNAGANPERTCHCDPFYGLSIKPGTVKIKPLSASRSAGGWEGDGTGKARRPVCDGVVFGFSRKQNPKFFI